MKFNYHSDGDFLYGVENYKLRFKALESVDIVDIELIHLIDHDDYYSFTITFTQPWVPENLRVIRATDPSVFESLGIEFREAHKSKRETLQHAIDVVNAVANKVGR